MRLLILLLLANVGVCRAQSRDEIDSTLFSLRADKFNLYMESIQMDDTISSILDKDSVFCFDRRNHELRQVEYRADYKGINSIITFSYIKGRLARVHVNPIEIDNYCFNMFIYFDKNGNLIGKVGLEDLQNLKTQALFLQNRSKELIEIYLQRKIRK